MNMQTIQNGADLVLLYQPLNLFLKPNANLTITISFPTDVSAGKSISNFDVMDKLRQMILPDNFSLLKVRLLSFLITVKLTELLFRFQRQLWNTLSSKLSSTIATNSRTSSLDWMLEKSSWMDFLTIHKSKQLKQNVTSRLVTTGIRSSAMLKIWMKWKLVNARTQFIYQDFRSNGSARAISRTTKMSSLVKASSSESLRNMEMFVSSIFLSAILIEIKWRRL